MNISLLMLINMAFACKYDMGGESRTRVCANCRDKSVIAKKTQWAQFLFLEVCYQLKMSGCCAKEHYKRVYDPDMISRAMANKIH